MTGPKRSLILDVQGLQIPEHADRGIPRFIRSHAEALIRTGRVSMLAFNPDLPLPQGVPAEFMAHPSCTWNTARALDRIEGPIAYVVMLPFEHGARAESLLPAALEERGALVAATVYDLIPHVMRDRYLADPKTRRGYDARLQLLTTADVLLAISDRTRADVIRLLGVQPTKVTNIGAGVDTFFHPRSEDEPDDEVDVPGLDRRFVLCVAGEDNNRKNVEGLLAAWAAVPHHMRADYQLVIVCRLSAAGEAYWRECATDVGLAPTDVVFTGSVSDDRLRSLYRNAVALVCPSLYEGFGLPAFEAAACGCPAIGASTSAMLELTCDRAAIFNPEETTEITTAIARVIGDDPWRHRLASDQQRTTARFTWDAVAAKTLSAVDAARLRRPIRPRPRRLRVAILTPLPPTMSGVADYSAQAVAALSDHAIVDAYATGEWSPGSAIGTARVRPASVFGRHVSPTAYDEVLYVIGNNGSHIPAVRAAERTPGIVWFHDTRLAGLHLVMDHRPIDPGWRHAYSAMHDRLQAVYGDRMPAGILARWGDPDAYDEFSIGLTAPIANNARAVLVHSDRAARMIDVDRGPAAAPLATHVIPFAASALPPGFVRAPEPDRVLVPGWMAWIKQPDLAIAGFARFRAARTNATLSFVGNMDLALEQQLRRLASQEGIAAEFHGFTSPETYWREIGRASCALLLRRTSRGESSAALHDVLQAGVPVVSNIPLDPPLQQAVHALSSAAGADEVAAALASAVDSPKPPPRLPTFDDVAQAVMAAIDHVRRTSSAV